MQHSKDAKVRANTLREIMNELGYPLKHSESLEALARFEGFRDWNTYSANLNRVLLPTPPNWNTTGESSDLYEVGSDPTLTFNKTPVATIRSKLSSQTSDKTFATLMQSIRTDDFINNRVQ